MGCNPSKENVRHLKDVDKAENVAGMRHFHNPEDANQQDITRQTLQSGSLVLKGSTGYSNNAGETGGQWRKRRDKWTEGEANTSDEINKYNANENRTTGVEKKVISTVIDVGNGMTIPLHQQTAEELQIDQRSPNQIIKHKRAKEEENIARDIEKDNQKKVDKEKARKRKQGLEVSLLDRISNLKSVFAGSVLEFKTLQKAAKKMNRHEKKGEKLFALTIDEQRQAKLKSIKQEKAALLHRLSEIASARLRHNNPDIADLSDENRATKLGEKLSELYDNEWTDLFEVIRNKIDGSDKEKIVAESLRDILKFCHAYCQRVARNQRVKLFYSLVMDNSKDLHSSPKELRLRLNEFQKNTSKQSLPYIQNMIKDGPKGITAMLKDNLVVRNSSKKGNYFNSYTELCTNITWHMQIQDPALVLDFGTEISHASSFRPYTVSGPVLYYVLWPAMLLHDNGPIIVKGVAQFKKANEKSESINGKDTNRRKKTNATNIKTADSVW